MLGKMLGVTVCINNYKSTNILDKKVFKKKKFLQILNFRMKEIKMSFRLVVVRPQIEIDGNCDWI